EPGETALHLAVRMVDRNSLHIVDFLAQNGECLKLLLRGKASVSIMNEAGETPMDIAKRLRHAQCEEQLTQAQTGKFNVHVHVEYEWRLQNEDMDESEDEMEDKPIPTRREERPVSCFLPGAASLARDKPRPQVPSMMMNNETYGTMMELPPPGPPLPPRGPSRGKPVAMETVGRQRSSSDPPNPQTPERNSSIYGSQPTSPQSPPTPKPRSTFSRVKAIYSCSADNVDELTFVEGEVIVVEGEEDSEWWFGHVEEDPTRRGVFPLTFVHFITE
ncbi:Arf-GAP with SH3 domain ANK repeat and PH domain containing protein 2, partial [Dissostichus eleginoides]